MYILEIRHSLHSFQFGFFWLQILHWELEKETAELVLHVCKKVLFLMVYVYMYESKYGKCSKISNIKKEKTP